MQITDIKIRKTFDDDGPMKAVVSVTFDDSLALHDIKVIYAKEKYFIVMPSRKNADGTYRDIVHPITAEFREILEKNVIDEYFKALEQASAQDVYKRQNLGTCNFLTCCNLSFCIAYNKLFGHHP